MAKSANRHRKPIKIVKTTVVALERRQVFGPWGENEKCAIKTSLEAAALRFPVLANGSGL